MSNMRILTLDIETSPNLVYSWGLWQQNIPIQFIVEPTYVMSWAAKWLGKKQIHCKAEGETGFLEDIWNLIDQADAVVHYNGTAFDMKHLHRQFVEAGMDKPLMPKEIDLLKTVRQQFKYPSNKLDYVAQRLLGKKKMKHSGIQLWIDCLNDVPAAWTEMKKYNKQDVALTEQLYLRLRGWIKSHPNHGLYVDDQEDPVCRACGSHKVQSKGYQVLTVNSYQRYRCMDCGWQGRGRERRHGSIITSKQVTV